MTRITGTLHEDQYIFIAISHSFLLRIGNVLDKNYRKNQSKYFMRKKFFFFENRVIYETSWKKSCAARHAKDYVIRRMHIAFWVPKAKNTHSKYLVLIAFPQQQCLHERVSTLRLFVPCKSC